MGVWVKVFMTVRHLQGKAVNYDRSFSLINELNLRIRLMSSLLGCTRRLITRHQLHWHQLLPSTQRVQHTSALARLDHLLNMGVVVIPRPESAVLAEEVTPTLLPFTYTISAFRGRSWNERGLLLHFKPLEVINEPPGQGCDSITWLLHSAAGVVTCACSKTCSAANTTQQKHPVPAGAAPAADSKASQ